MESGTTVTVNQPLSELNGRKATIESFDAATKLFTCSVALPSGLEELVNLRLEDLQNVVAPKARPSVNLRFEQSAEYFGSGCGHDHGHTHGGSCCGHDHAHAEKAQAAIAVGAAVRISGLVGRPELNGCLGKVTSFDGAKNRFGVAVEGRDETVALKPTNLSTHAEEPQGMPARMAAALAARGGGSGGDCCGHDHDHAEAHGHAHGGGGGDCCGGGGDCCGHDHAHAEPVHDHVHDHAHNRTEPDGNARLAAWWGAYQTAFEAEHTWMEARGQKTSRAIGSQPDGAQLMQRLVFQSAPAPFQRQCFFAFAGADATEACGYATVDVDPHPQKVCHVRMCMVDPAMQGKGIGEALMRHVVSVFEDRHLGLKFSNHEPRLEAFYSRVGFARIGKDQLYTYMAIKR